jgi:hypothetical protein
MDGRDGMKRTKAILALAALAVMPAVAGFFPPANLLADAPAAAPAGAATQPVGLDSLGDDRLLNELAARGLDDLLNRTFDADHIPQTRRDAIRTLSSIQRLANDSTLTDAQRQQLIDGIVRNLDKVLPNLNDPEALLAQGQIFDAQVVENDVDILEFWGETDAQKAKLRPEAEAAIKIYDRAMQLASARADELANNISSPTDPKAIEWQKANDLFSAGQYQKAIVSYALALSMDIADRTRPKLISDNLKQLADWDSADSGIQPQVRLLMARYNLLKQNPQGVSAAKALLDSLLNDPNHKIAPQPAPALLFEARCFRVLASLAASDPRGAKSALDDATADQQKNFPDVKEDAAALRLLNYRIIAYQADHAPAGPEKIAANKDAVAALGKLVDDFPGLRKVIFAQLVARLPSTPDMASTDPMLLDALIENAKQEIKSKKPGDSFDKAKVQQGLDASREMLKRFDAQQIPEAEAINASLMVGIFQEFLGNNVAAVDALLTHAQKFANTPKSFAGDALDEAQNVIAQLSQAAAAGQADPDLDRVQDRFLQIALNPPFNRREFALRYASRLRNEGKYEEAIRYYDMVPDTDKPAQVMTARFGEMAALEAELSESKNLQPAERQQVISHIQGLADAVIRTANDLLKNPADDAEKTRARVIIAQTSLAAAGLALHEQNDAARTIQLLTGFEDQVAGLPEAKTLTNAALSLRVQSFMQLKDTASATNALVKYLNQASSDEGAQFALQLLNTLNANLAKAQADQDAAHQAGDAAAEQKAVAQVHELADDRATLSGFLVKWAQDNKDPANHAKTYTYELFDADTRRLAAELETDPEARKKDLSAVLEQFKTLQSPENLSLYQATLPPDNVADKEADPLVKLYIGFIAYDLGDSKTAVSNLGDLVRNEKLGENNDNYWQATYELLDSMHALAKAGDPSITDAQVQQSLKLLYLVWRDGTGGKKWHDKFEALRKEVMPDWVMPATKPS